MPSYNNTDQEDIYSIGSQDKKTRVKQRKYFPTPRGAQIVNAVSGYVYPWTQGSFEERRLYKTMDLTAYYDNKGCRRSRRALPGSEPNLLYYDSPEQYMMHKGVKLPQSKIMSWHENNRALFKEENNI